jgi:DUF2075 family protein
MIVYQQTKEGFLRDALDRDIEEVVAAAYLESTGARVGRAELRSWRESLLCMAKVLRDPAIPEDAGVAIEYHLPQMSKRIDFIVSGRGEDRAPNLVIVELKQWSAAAATEKDGIVSTWIGGGHQEVSHPSYQAWSYAALLRNFNEEVDEGSDVDLLPCAYLHNHPPAGGVSDPRYQPWIERAPLFLKGEAERQRLRDFIARHVRHGDAGALLYRIEHGRIRPSKSLADSITRMLKGSQEFVLVDEQKVAYETVLRKADLGVAGAKQVVIVEGGPGTGKSVVAVNLLVELTRRGQLCQYVSRNAAPREVFQARLTGSFRKSHITNLFRGSGAFTEAGPPVFDTLVVDEAHRLNEKSGLYGNLGNNQIREIIAAARCAVFFLDEDQRVTIKDIGTREAIERWAQEGGAQVTRLELASQFRCNGSDGYLAWLDDVLGLRSTANTLLSNGEFDFRVLDSPVELHALITERNRERNRARVVAGYCWEWASKKDAAANDIVIPEFGYARQWNLTRDGSLWIISPESVEQVGCIHTCQGLEVDYVGVIVGDDFIVRDGRVRTRPECRARTDKTIRGYKSLLGTAEGAALVDRVIRNTYRTLMTRGMKGCYIYCTDPETAAWFRSRLGPPVARVAAVPTRTPAVVPAPRAAESAMVLPFRRVPPREVRPYRNAVPLVDLKFAAGGFGDVQSFDEGATEWVELPGHLQPRDGFFVAQVVGESMNRQIPNGAWCLFRLHPRGTRQGKVVVAQHRAIADPEHGGSFTIKQYTSEKRADEGGWSHTRILLRPNSDDPRFQPIELDPAQAEDLRIVAELVQVL